jgi:2-iminoacetate synthase ThiH
MTVHDLVRLVREAGRRPIERDTVFHVVKEW